MANKKYKALQDVSIGGVTHGKGKTFEAASNSGHITTALHFKQIEDLQAVADAKEEAEKKEREAADAKAKEAEAAAKAAGANK